MASKVQKQGGVVPPPRPRCVSSNLKKRLGLIRFVKEGIFGQPGWGPRRRLGQKVSASWLLVSLGIYTGGGWGWAFRSFYTCPSMFFFWHRSGPQPLIPGLMETFFCQFRQKNVGATRLPDPTAELSAAGRSPALRTAGRGASGPSARARSWARPESRSAGAGSPW